MTTRSTPHGAGTKRAADLAFATWAYRLRWPLSLVAILAIGLALRAGAQAVGGLTQGLAELSDTSNGLAPQPLLFDPRMDIWFGLGDPAVETYREVERLFVAEDYIVIAFEEKEGELGVFGRRALETTARLTEALLGVPGVRHVRSLTSAPWIRYGPIDGGPEEGLIVSDLIEVPAEEIGALQDGELLDRMIAVLGAAAAAERVGEARVRERLGTEARFEDHIGEPLMLGTLVNRAATLSGIQVQVLRGRVEEAALDAAFAGLPVLKEKAPALFSVQYQHAALRGVEHVLRTELGRSLPTAELSTLEQWIDSLPEGDEKTRLAFELEDPTRNFVTDASGASVRKYHEYDPDGDGHWIDRSDPMASVAAPPDDSPTPRGPYEFRLAGMPPFERNFMDVGMADAKYMGLVMLLIALVLAVLSRSVMGVVAALAVVAGSVLGMVGTVLSWGDLFNNLTAISPNMLTAVGIADAVHLVAAWITLRKRYTDKRAMMIEVVRRNALPVFLTSITTAVGFYSLTVSQIGPMRMLGYTAGLGTLIAYGLSMTVVPALLSLVPLPKQPAPAAAEADRHAPGPLSRGMADWVLGHRRAILSSSVVVLLLTVLGLMRFSIDTDFRAMFPDDNPVMSDFRWIESRLGGVGDVEIVFKGKPLSEQETDDERAALRERLADLTLRDLGARSAPAEFQELLADERAELASLRVRIDAIDAGRIAASAAFYRELEAFEDRLLGEMADPASPLHILTDLTSPLDILRKIHQVQNENRGEHYRVPGEGDVAPDAREPRLTLDPWTEEWEYHPGQNAANLIAQYFLQYENGARPGENLATQISADRRSFRLQGRVKQAPTMLQQAAFDRIAEIGATEFPKLALGVRYEPDADEGVPDPGASTMTVSGKTVLFSRTPEAFTVGFIESMGIALVVITLLIALIFRSLWIAVISIVPNLLPILIPLSFIGLTGEPLDGPAILVASVALGVCVDDTIHFFAKFTRARRQGHDLRESLVLTYDQVGRALTVTTIVLVLGFAGLTLSDFRPNFMMGTLATAMFFLAWVADIFVTPALLSLLPQRDSAQAQGSSAPDDADTPPRRRDAAIPQSA